MERANGRRGETANKEVLAVGSRLSSAKNAEALWLWVKNINPAA